RGAPFRRSYGWVSGIGCGGSSPCDASSDLTSHPKRDSNNSGAGSVTGASPMPLNGGGVLPHNHPSHCPRNPASSSNTPDCSLSRPILAQTPVIPEIVYRVLGCGFEHISIGHGIISSRRSQPRSLL